MQPQDRELDLSKLERPGVATVIVAAVSDAFLVSALETLGVGLLQLIAFAIAGIAVTAIIAVIAIIIVTAIVAVTTVSVVTASLPGVASSLLYAFVKAFLVCLANVFAADVIAIAVVISVVIVAVTVVVVAIVLVLIVLIVLVVLIVLPVIAVAVAVLGAQTGQKNK